ncbi:MAG: carbohydrate ABC transporter permease [Lachnospiraceae bacterium]
MKKISFSKITIYIFFILAAFICLVPFWWMLMSSFKYASDIFAVPIQWIPKRVTINNYVKLFNEIPFLKYIFNSSKLTVIITLGQVLTCTLAAYAFARLRFPGRNQIFLAYLGTMMIPWHAIMIPQFDIITKLGLYDTHSGLILLHLFSPFGVFLLRQYFLSIPNDLSEAARIDGCGELRLCYQIIVPLCKPAIATLIIFTFKNTWNDYLGPLIYLNSQENYTIQIGLKRFVGMYGTDFGPILAGAVISVIPILIIFVCSQKYFVEGIAMSGIKG